jgi:hypothetical protein
MRMTGMASVDAGESSVDDGFAQVPNPLVASHFAIFKFEKREVASSFMCFSIGSLLPIMTSLSTWHHSEAVSHMVSQKLQTRRDPMSRRCLEHPVAPDSKTESQGHLH